MDKIKRSLHITDWNVYNKIDELVKGYNESLEGVERRWKEQISINKGLTEYCDRILKRLDEHINEENWNIKDIVLPNLVYKAFYVILIIHLIPSYAY